MVLLLRRMTKTMRIAQRQCYFCHDRYHSKPEVKQRFADVNVQELGAYFWFLGCVLLDTLQKQSCYVFDVLQDNLEYCYFLDLEKENDYYSLARKDSCQEEVIASRHLMLMMMMEISLEVIEEDVDA